MKRLHVHISVDDLPTSIRFYNTLFDSEPTIIRHDYAKWMLDDPRVNFAISKRTGGAGIGHLGIQVENRTELADVYSRFKHADASVLEKAVPAAVTRSARRAGSPTRRESGGRRITRPARAQIIAMSFPRTAARVLAVPIRSTEGVPTWERPDATAGNAARRG